jgi:hypothetical protein
MSVKKLDLSKMKKVSVKINPITGMVLEETVKEPNESPLQALQKKRNEAMQRKLGN